jgi:hypothetical protein
MINKRLLGRRARPDSDGRALGLLADKELIIPLDGLAAAMAWPLFVIILGITALQMAVGNRLVHYEGGNQ